MTVTQAVERLVKACVHLGDADLEKTYVWEEYAEDGLRFALLTAHHQLRDVHAHNFVRYLRQGCRAIARPTSEVQRANTFRESRRERVSRHVFVPQVHADLTGNHAFSSKFGHE